MPTTFCEDPTALHEEGLTSCKLRPTVLFGIADHFTRRQDEQGRVIGTLLGSVTDGVVDIVNSFPVPHSEAEQATIDSDFNSTMFALHRKVHPKQVVVGWYSTGAELTHNDQFYHQFFEEQAGEGAAPVFLLVDMSLSAAGVKTKAFVRSELNLGGKHVASAFEDIRLRIAKSEAERIGLDHIVRSSMAGGDGPQELVPLRPEVDTNHWRMCKLLDAVDKMRAYIEQVEAGKVAPNAAIGRALADALAAVPKPDAAEFNQMLDGNMQVRRGRRFGVTATRGRPRERRAHACARVTHPSRRRRPPAARRALRRPRPLASPRPRVHPRLALTRNAIPPCYRALNASTGHAHGQLPVKPHAHAAGPLRKARRAADVSRVGLRLPRVDPLTSTCAMPAAVGPRKRWRGLLAKCSALGSQNAVEWRGAEPLGGGGGLRNHCAHAHRYGNVVACEGRSGSGEGARCQVPLAEL
jgi:translation initiation factor 3 subunit F